jgi:hypothetical protein
MDDKKYESLWSYYKDQREHGKSFDQQRSNILNFIVAISAGIFAFLSAKGFCREMIPVSLFVIIIGIYGIIIVRKLYERSIYHFMRARECLIEIQSLCDIDFDVIHKNSLSKHLKQFPFSYKMKTHVIWSILCFLISFLGFYIFCKSV